ncbi:hypothetical protein SK128_010628 [Halocaridina rubra]|uniref:Uncharacterized protein n=1 Tax=Halocaridina rubra TaxID=373956 RepID=A0AAN8XA02_HALRR
MAHDVDYKQNKKTKNKLAKKLSPVITVKASFTSFESLKTKTKHKLQALRTVTISISPVVANERGYEDLQFVTVTGSDTAVPAMLVLDSNTIQKASIVTERNKRMAYFLSQQ